MATMDGSTVAPIPAEEQTHPTVAQRDGEISRHRTEAGDQETISPISFSRRAPTFHRHRIGRTQAVELSVSLNGAGLSVNTIDQFETRCIRCTTQPSHRPSLYVVVGLFSAVDHQPRERVIRIKNHEHLFRELRWATFRLRGLRYFLSLKSVRSFRLYKCSIPTGAHKHLDLDSSAQSDLKQFLVAYKSRWVPKEVNLGWADWIHKCLNQNSTDLVTDGAYSLEIKLGWSASRISVAVLVPVILSLVIGCWFNSRDWTDLATIQTAWGIASYIATAGGLVAALLAIVSGLSEI